MNSSRMLFLICVLGLFSGTATAQSEWLVQRQALENEIESRILSEVRKYYPDLRLLLSAEVVLRETGDGQDAPDNRDFTLPGVKGFESRRAPLSSAELPVQRISVRLLFDKNTRLEYGELARLLENIVYYAGKLNRARGDRAEVEAISFPQSKELLDTQVSPPVVPRRVLLPGPDSVRITVYDTIRTPARTPGYPSSFSPEQDPRTAQATDEVSPYLIGAGVLVLLLIVGILLLGTRLRAEQKRVTVREEALRVQREQYEAREREAEQAVPESLERGRRKREVKRLSTGLISSAVGTPEIFASMLKEWMTIPEKRETVQVLLSELGPSVLQVVEHGLPDGDMRELKTLAVEKVQKEPGEAEAILQTVSTELRLRQASAHKEENRNPFAFLQGLNEAQLFLLMKDQPPGINAILLSQLSPGLAGSLLRNLPSMQQGEVALELVKLRRLTSDAYVSVAKELASKAARIPTISNVQVQGTDVLLDIFDSLDESEEHSISEFIKVMNIDMYRQITDQRVAFNAFATLDDRVVRQLMKDMPGEEVAVALKQAPEEIRTKFLSVLPTRAKALLEERISGLDGVTPEEEQKMRRKMTRMMRNYLRLGRAEQSAAG